MVKKVRKQEITEQEIEAAKKELFSRIIDAEGMDEYEAQCIALMYIDLAQGDTNSKISVKMMKQFLTEVVKPNSPKGRFEKVMNYYDFKNGNYSDKKMVRLYKTIESFWNQFKTMENAYMYSYGFREIVNKLQTKLLVKGEMSPLEKVKWLRVWIVLIRDQHLFWGDVDKDGKLKSKAERLRLENTRIQPETLIYLWDFYFKYMPDNNIILEMLEWFIESKPEDVQKKIRAYGEFDENETNAQKISTIRKMKIEIFPKQWVAVPAYFFTTKGIEMLNPERLEQVIDTYNNGGVEKLETLKMKCYNIETDKIEDINCSIIKDNFTVSCQEEMEMYVLVYKWLLENPKFKFGVEMKTLSEYNLTNLFDKYEDLLQKWILDASYAKDTEDINFELLKKVVSKEKYKELLLKYYEEEISLEEVNSQIGIKDDCQGMMLASKTMCLSEKNAREFQDTIKRVVRFGTKNCKRSDSIYLEIFRDMLENRPEDLPKGMAKMYKDRV